MEVIGVLFLGLAIGFLSCLLLRVNGRRGKTYALAGLGIAFGAFLVSLTAGQSQLSWYMDALASGVLLCWMTVLGGRGEIKRLLTRIKIGLR
jgi:NhaP-type Na+/H+ or K+/H+ antiporter